MWLDCGHGRLSEQVRMLDLVQGQGVKYLAGDQGPTRQGLHGSFLHWDPINKCFTSLKLCKPMLKRYSSGDVNVLGKYPCYQLGEQGFIETVQIGPAALWLGVQRVDDHFHYGRSGPVGYASCPAWRSPALCGQSLCVCSYYAHTFCTWAILPTSSATWALLPTFVAWNHLRYSLVPSAHLRHCSHGPRSVFKPSFFLAMLCYVLPLDMLLGAILVCFLACAVWVSLVSGPDRVSP